MTTQASIVHGLPLAEEPGLGALTIAGYLREVTQRYGDREALVLHTASGRTSWTYNDLWQRSVGVASALIAAGVGKDTRVGILMTNRPEYLSALFGTAMAGGIAVALSTFSTSSELEHLLKASGVSVLLYERQVLKKDFGAMLGELEPRIRTAKPGSFSSEKFPFLRQLVVLDAVTAVAEAPLADATIVTRWKDFLNGGLGINASLVEARAATVSPGDAGVLFFSSGTTSLPKGIFHAQRALAIQWWRWSRLMDIDAVNHPVRCWTGNGFFWSGNLSMVLGNALTTGGAVILQPAFQADDALTIMEKERVSFPIGRPHQWARLEASPKWAGANLSSLHYVTYGATLLKHPTAKTDWQLRPAFGTTETLTINTAVPANTAEADFKGSYGLPLPGNILKIVDTATGAIVPRGQRGEIGIKGPTLMLGYIGKTSEETFDSEGYFMTGDGGYVDDAGRLFWEGRLTEIIKTGGANVSPLEIDAVLALCPGVKRGQTLGLPHDTLGEMVVSCVIPHEGAQIDEAGVQAFLKERLASFKVPRRVLLLSEDEVQVTGNGKVKVGELRELAGKRLAAA